MNIDQILDGIYLLPGPSRTALKEHISGISYPKGHILFRADTVGRKIYFIRRGIVRAYTDLPDREVTFWFGWEGDPVVSMKSYVAGMKGYENVELLEPCELYELDSRRLHELFEKDIHIANWGRKFAEQELARTEERFIARQFRTSKERYHELMEQNPGLLQRVPLGYIASYLGITQVSLSRIRARKR